MRGVDKNGARDRPDVDGFLRDIESMRWFVNIGVPVSPASRVKQIRAWDEWAGPDDEAVGELHSRQQSLYDEIMKLDQSGAGRALWDRIHAIVQRVAAASVPYDAKEDAWYGPNVAVWQAAWTAGLVGLYLYFRRPLPQDLTEQWQWFLKGHWPCDWEGTFPNGTAIIY
jgi:hypothetical protein